ncbi:MAG: hypothetical protein V4674_00410 [Patescibacteria group bacterium]
MIVSKKNSLLSLISALFLCLLFLFGASSLSAQQLSEGERAAQEAQWRIELAATEAEIAKWQAELNKTKQGTKSLQGEASKLQAKINEAKAFIKQRQVQIEKLIRDIGEKTKAIGHLVVKEGEAKDFIAVLLRATNRADAFSASEVIFSGESVSDLFENVDSYSSVSRSLGEKLTDVRDLHTRTEEERKALDQKRIQEADKKAQIETDKKKIERDEAEKQRLIAINKTTEKTYQQVITEKQKRASEIRAALFRLRDSEGIPFGDALRYATAASEKTGVRPALILAILTQESDLGKNVGSCLVSNLETGDGAGKNSGSFFEQVMKAPRDTTPFGLITARLGRDWKMTPVSCPPAAKYVVGRGFGGAMGPSQFIASTWELFKNRIGALVGTSGDQADPWNPAHAFMATALYMSDLGARAESPTAEKNAACRYYSGRACDSKSPSNAFYGAQVMAKAQNIQLNMIDPLEGF